MASNDNIDLTIRAKLDDKASKDLKNLSGSIDKIKGEVTTTAKADTGAAENKVKTYKDKLDSIQKSVSTKVFANTKSAHASIENLKRKLDAFDKKNYDVKVSVKADGAIKAISSLSRALQTLEKRTKDFSINVDMGSTEKVAKNLENVVGRIKAIDKNAHISFSSEGFNGLSSELKEIYGLLKGINKYKDVNVSGRANISRQRATSTKNNGRKVNNDSKQFNDLRKQLASTITEINKFDTSADNGNKALNARVQEALGIMNNMKQFLTERGKLSYAAESKLYGNFLPSIKNEYARREWLKRQRVAAVNNNYANLGSGLRSNVEGNYEPTISALKNILTTRLSGVELAKLAGSFERGFGSGMHELARQSEMVERSILGINRGLVAIPEAISTSVAAFAGFSVALGIAESAIETLFSVVQSIGSAIADYIIKPGLEAANAMQMMRNGIAGAMSSIGLLNNQPLQFSEALNMADGIVKQLAVDAIKTGTSLEAITNTFRAIIEPGLQAGMNISQIEEMANLFTTIGKELQLNSLTIARDTRDIFNGMANRTVMAKQLGITDQEIQAVKAKGEDLYAWLENRLAGFVASNRENIATLGGAFDSLKSTWELTLASVFDNDAVKQPVIEFMKWVGSQIATVYDMGINPNSEKWDALKKSSAARNGIDTSDQAAVDQNAEDTGLQDDATKYRDATGATEEETQALEEQNATVITLSDSFEALINFVTNFVDIVGEAVIEVAEYAEQSLGAEDSVKSLSDAIGICVDLLVFIAERIIDVIALVEENRTSIEDLGYDALYVCAILKNVFLGIISFVKPVVAIFRTLYNVVKAVWDLMHGDAEGAAKAFTQAGVDAAEAAKGMLKKYIPFAGVAITGADIITNSYRDIQTINGWREKGQQAREAGENSQPYKNLHGFTDGIRNFLNNRNHVLSTQNPNQNLLKGRPADDSKERAKAQREADKARREAIKESQRMLKERQQALKEILEDKLNELKDLLKKNEIAYKEGFKSIGEYFTQKAELEKQEAQARLEEAQQEREAIANSKFDSEYQKLAALHKVDREIRKYTRELSNATKAQQGVANILTQYKNTIRNSNLFGTLNRVNSGTNSITNSNISTNLTQEEADEKSRGDASVKVLERSAGDYGYVVDEIVNQILSNKDYTIPPILAVALARQESGFDNSAISPMGAIGIGQLMPDTAKSLGVNPYDWKQNITGMLKYLQMLWDKFNGDLDKVLAAYNAGPQAVVEYGGIPPYRETINYVDSIKGFMNEYYDNGYNIKSNELLRKANEKLWQSQQENTQAVQSNTQGVGYLANTADGIDHNFIKWSGLAGDGGFDDLNNMKPYSKMLLNELGKRYFEYTGGKTFDYNIATLGNHAGGEDSHGDGGKVDAAYYLDEDVLKRIAEELKIAIGHEDEGGDNDHFDISLGVGNIGGRSLTGAMTGSEGKNMVLSGKTSNNTLNNLQQAQVDTTDLEQQMREALNKFIEEYNSVVEEIRSNIFYEMPDPKVKFRETYKKLEDAKKIAKNNPDATALVEKYEMLINQQITKLVTEFYENALEVNLQTVQDTGEKIANKLATGSVDSKQLEEYYKKYWGYFYGDGKDVLQMKKRLEDLKAKQKEIENKYNSDTSNSTYIKELEDSFQRSNDALWLAKENKKPAEEIEKLTREVEAKRAQMLAGYAKRDELSRPYQEEINKLDQETKLAMQTPLNQIVQLEKQFIKYQKAGNVSAAVEIRKRLDSARQALYGIFDSWIKAIESKYEFESNYFDKMPVTNLQKEQGNQLLSAYKNRELAGANQNKLDALNREYMKRLEMIDVYEKEADELEKVQKKSRRGTKEYNERTDKLQELRDKIQALKFPLSDLYRQIGDTTQIIRLEKELAKIPTLLQNIGKVAKQSLEDNLVNFMTEGINTATSFKQAFGEMLMSILKDIQTFLAKETVRDLMTALFGHYHSEGVSAGDSKGALYLKASAKSLKEIQTGDANKKQQLEVLANGEGIIGGNLVTIDTVDVPTKKIQTKPQYFGSDWYEKNNGLGKYSFKLDKPWEKRQVKSEVVLDAESTKKLLYETRDKSKQIEQKIDVEKLGANTQAVVDRLNGINTTLQTIDSHITGKPIENKEVKENTEAIKEQSNKVDENTDATKATGEIAQEAKISTEQNTASNEQVSTTTEQAGMQVEQANTSVQTATVAVDNNTQATEGNTMSQGSGGGGGGTTFAGGYGYNGVGLMSGEGTLGASIGGTISSILSPITGIVSSVASNVAGILNADAFKSLLGSLDSITGSAGGQLGGSIFAINSLVKGDKKEKLLSLIYLELQLIYNALISKASGFATGGYISGIGTSTSDSIPAMLSNGEYVVKASSVRKYGTNFLNAVNDGSFSRIPNLINVPKFADGGEVAAQETARGMSTFASTLGTNVSSTTNMNVALVSNQEEAIAHFMRSPRGQRIMLDFTRGSAKFTNKIVGSY